MECEETLRVLETKKEGLSEVESLRRIAYFGPNTIDERPRRSRLTIMLNQLANPLILILCAAAVMTIIVGEGIESVVIIGAVVVNTILGYYQENKAETALASLASYITIRARVRRDDHERECNATMLVPGDVITVTRGDRVPADARLLFAKNLQVDESILTGEALPTIKQNEKVPFGATLAERRSMLWSGTLVVDGVGEAVATATDNDSELGRIAAMVTHGEKEQTPLQRMIAQIASFIGIGVLILVAPVVMLGLASGYAVIDILVIAIAIAVAAVPEGLPIATMVILAVGVERLAKKKGVIRKLLAAETLGSTSVILTDKTGTLTEAKMTLVDAKHELLRDALFATSVVIENPEDDAHAWRMVGNPIDRALVAGAAERQVNYVKELAAINRIEQLPFSAETRFAAALIRVDGRHRIILFGAPESLMQRSTIAAREEKETHDAINIRADRGERILGIAIKDVDVSTDVLNDQTMRGLTFRGLLAFHDPVRADVRHAIARVRATGVRTIIVTGDHRGTGVAVARELGILQDGEGVMTGDEMKTLDPAELRARAATVSVYARVSPEQKAMLVKIYQERGEIVALAGDGVNDAPAIQQADIGIAVGSGTEVAKSAADLVLLDDNFETIVVAIEEGRRILANIKKVIVYTFSNILDEFLLIGGSLLVGLALPVNALQILLVNLFTDSIPAIAFAFEESDSAGRRPHQLGKGFFDEKLRVLIFVIGVATSLLLFVLYVGLLRAGFNEAIVRTFIFASLATYSLFVTFSLKSLEKNITAYHIFDNHYLTVGVAMGIVTTALAVYVPALQTTLHTVALPVSWVVGVLAVGLVNVAAVEVVKYYLRARR